MLTCYDGARAYGRRDFLRIGGLTLGGVSLLDLLSLQATATERSPLTGKSVVFLFMHGGPSQIETFDPKMMAPAGVRSATGEVSTSLPGVTFGGSFPKIARLADRIAVIRSFVTGDGIHDIKPVVGKDTAGANLGSVYARVAGANNPRTGVPNTTALFPRSVVPEAQPGNMNFGSFTSTGSLGNGYAPLVPGSGGPFQSDLRLNLPLSRLDDRRQLLTSLDSVRRALDTSRSIQALDKVRGQAFDTIVGGAADAFDWSKEDPDVIARYDTSPLVRPEEISRKWNNYDNYVDNARSLGKLMLLARRLCEAGCGFVTVTTNFVWDMHSDVNNAGMEEGMRYMGPPFDHAISAFLEDVEARGLSDRILLVACGEMGRTPKINDRGGRDHWGRLAPLLIAGGGLKMGQVIGESSRDAGEPAGQAYMISELVSTIMHALFHVGDVRTLRGIPADAMQVITGGHPIEKLV